MTVKGLKASIAVSDRMAQRIKVEYVFQDFTDLPEGFAVPEGRVKPWGTVRIIREYFIELDCTVPVRSGGGLEHSECAAG